MLPAGLWPLTLGLPILAYVAQSDLRRMRIPNWTALALVAVFVLTAPFVGWTEAGWRALSAAIVFAVGFALFALRIVAGGDVKILAALALLVPVATLTLFWLVFAGAMAAAILLVVALRALPAARGTGWVSMRARGTLPMGIAIAAAGWVHWAILAAVNAG